MLGSSGGKTKRRSWTRESGAKGQQSNLKPAEHQRTLRMSSGSLAALTGKAASKDNVDISSSSLSDIPELDAFTPPSSNPGVLSKRPGPQPIPNRGNTNKSRHAFSRIPSEYTSGPPSPSASMDTMSRGMRSFVTDADTSTALDDSALDTPVRDKKSLLGDEVADVRKRGRASLGAPPKGQMTLREQEKAGRGLYVLWFCEAWFLTGVSSLQYSSLT